MSVVELLRAAGQAIATAALHYFLQREIADDARMPRSTSEILQEVLASAPRRDAQTRSAF